MSGTCSMHEGDEKRRWLVFWDVASLWLIALMIEAANTSKTSVNIYQTTRRIIPEDSHLRTRRRENLKSHRDAKRLQNSSPKIWREDITMDVNFRLCGCRIYSTGNFMTSWLTISFWRRALFNGVLDLLLKEKLHDGRDSSCGNVR
jgi:hypothetical protein